MNPEKPAEREGGVSSGGATWAALMTAASALVGAVAAIITALRG